MAKTNKSRIVIWAVVGVLVVVAAVMFLSKPKDAKLSGPPVTPKMIEKQLARLDKFEAKIAQGQSDFPGAPAETWQQISTLVAKCRETLNGMASLTDQKELKAKLTDAQKDLIEARKLLKEITGQTTSDDDAGQ